MIQFNLLPDLKLKYIKAERQKRLVLTISSLVTIGSLLVLAFLLVTVNVVQSKSLDDLENDITEVSDQLKEVENIDKILTVQSQLNSLSGLHDQKVVSSRMFGYIMSITPSDVSISRIEVDYAASTLSVSGTVESLNIVNKYADSFKFTTLQVADKNDATAFLDPLTQEQIEELPAAFDNVVLESFSRGAEDAEYTLTMAFDPQLFDGKLKTKLTIPKIFTDSPDAKRPEAVFQAAPQEGTM